MAMMIAGALCIALPILLVTHTYLLLTNRSTLEAAMLQRNPHPFMRTKSVMRADVRSKSRTLRKKKTHKQLSMVKREMDMGACWADVFGDNGKTYLWPNKPSDRRVDGINWSIKI